MAIKEMVLRDTTSHDMSRVEEFYLSAPAEDLRFLRLHLEDHAKAIDSALHFVVEVDHRIVAATMITPPPEESHFAEAGNTLVLKSFRGYSLQTFFLEIRAAALAATEPRFILTTGVNVKNKSSYDNVTSSGQFSRWNPPDSYYDLCEEDQVTKRKECSWRADALAQGRRCCCDFFLLGKENQRKLVRGYLDRIKGRSFLEIARPGGDLARLVLESQWATRDLHLQTLELFSEGREWLPL